MNFAHPVLLRFILFIVFPLAAVLLWGYFHLKQSLPQTSGVTEVNGIEQPVTLSRDHRGIVQINAKTDQDAFYALGYAHAQDRLWQLEVQRRTVQGRLSEIFGKESVNMDIWFRTLGLYQRAVNAWQALSPQAQNTLTAYTAGVNAYLNSKPVLPAEFLLLDIQPEPWQVYHSLAHIKLFALNLSGNFQRDIARMLAGRKLNQQQLATLFDSYPADAPTTVAQGDSSPVSQLPELTSEQQRKLTQLLALQKSIENQLQIGGRFVGSNGWVVSPQHSQSGQAILANDPHLGLQIPSQWYAASLKGDKIDVAGMSLVGLPLVIFGRNADISWGGTAMMTDNQDLYFERVNPADADLYYAQGQWQRFEVRKESIAVRADFPSTMRKALKPIEIEVRSTRHGPVISDQFDVFEHPVSLGWTALTDNDTTFEAFFKLNYAKDWSGFKQALSALVAPSINVLYADRRGNIGYVGAGQTPIRNKGNGEFPVPGWDEQYHWRGVVPPSEWPSDYNPEKGFIVSANNKVAGDDYPYFVSRDWAPPERAERITQLLQQKIARAESKPGQHLTIDDMIEIQADTLSISALQLLPLLTDLTHETVRQKVAIELLSNWDGDMRRDSPAAALFAVWSRKLREAMFSDELDVKWGEVVEEGFLKGVASEVSTQSVAAQLADSPWCDNVTTSEVENCNTILLQSLEDSMSQLDKLLGGDLDDWEWGEVHFTAYDHQPFSGMKLLDGIFERKIDNGGGANTVNVSGASFEESVGYLQTFGAAFRQIISLGYEGIEAKNTHLLMNSTGQSGNVVSEHYDDMVVPFRDVEFIPFEVDGEKQTMTLQPQGYAAKQEMQP